MSWFSLTVSGKQIWDSHSFLNNLVSGGMIGKFIMDSGVKKTTYYQLARERISTFLSLYFCEKLTPYNKKVAVTLLQESINKEALIQVSKALTNRLRHVSKDDLAWAFKGSYEALKVLSHGTYNYLSNPHIYKSYLLSLLQVHKNQLITRDFGGKELSEEEVNKIVDHVAANYSKEDSEILFNLLKEFKFTEFGCKAVILSLEPVCEKAVKAVITSTAKAGVGLGMDLTVKKVITIATLPLIYAITRSAFQMSADYLPPNPIMESISEGAANYLPSIGTVIWGSAAMHLGIAGYLFWNTVNDSSSKVINDKVAIKELAIKLSKNSIARKIDEHPLLKMIGLKLEPETVDQLATMLIQQTVEFYWPKLSQTKFLGIPLAREAQI